MEDRQGRINQLLDELEPEHRDYVKQAIRDIATHSIGISDEIQECDPTTQQHAA